MNIGEANAVTHLLRALDDTGPRALAVDAAARTARLAGDLEMLRRRAGKALMVCVDVDVDAIAHRVVHGETRP